MEMAWEGFCHLKKQLLLSTCFGALEEALGSRLLFLISAYTKEKHWDPQNRQEAAGDGKEIKDL